MFVPTLRNAALPLALIAAHASAFTISFYSDADCKTESLLSRTIANSTEQRSDCEAFDDQTGKKVVAAKLVLDDGDKFFNYAGVMYDGRGCSDFDDSKRVAPDTCTEAHFGVKSFDIDSSDTTFDFGDLVNWKPAVLKARSAQAVGSSGVDPDCDDTVVHAVTAVDRDGNQVADGVITEIGAISADGTRSVTEKTETYFDGDIEGAVLTGQVTANNPTLNEVWEEDPGDAVNVNVNVAGSSGLY
ncbi:hypothetical protein DRE_04372 [Drechslerella stenobrocha 248]|uniref:Uncharacterized protein n=1 Tax=Drechslerella stenobrocha 248 TaxID=1043628 RepID=W7HT04_9PEZI|nr:hypothetical protein DRE_04372 [Drechslerella stenobrocha 248]